jgi:hypothetical protein
MSIAVGRIALANLSMTAQSSSDSGKTRTAVDGEPASLRHNRKP